MLYSHIFVRNNLFLTKMSEYREERIFLNNNIHKPHTAHDLTQK